MNANSWIGWLLGLENVTAINAVDPSFAAPWAHQAPAWVFFGCLALCALALTYYLKYQPTKRPKTRLALAIVRALVLCLLLIVLADPVLTVKINNSPRPQLWFLFDGTESMAIEDTLSDTERERLNKAVSLKPAAEPSSAKPTRADYVRSWIQNKDAKVLARLSEKFRLRGFILDRPDGIRNLEWSSSAGDAVDLAKAAEQLTTTGQVTALGKAFDDLAQRRAAGQLAGLVVVSDFDQNSGPPPLARAQKLGVPVYAVGVGPAAAVDLAVDLQAPPVMKKSERSTVLVTLRPSGLEGQSVVVTVTARPLDAAASAAPEASIEVGRRTVELKGNTLAVEFPYTPEQAGRFEFLVDVPALSGEVVSENNRAAREVNIRDDFLRLLFVEYEPTWEWRFIKEVFHRDPLVGVRGFRTFLRSSDPKVRGGNELFLPTLTPKRSDFFASDVIFLGDVPAEMLSGHFCDMVKEYVSTFGGGLVILGGPRFGPGQLASTPLAELLPVSIEPESRRRESREREEFPLRLTAEAYQYDFMQLGSNPSENKKAWDNLGMLSWYHPVSRPHPLATVLAEHPKDTCADGKTPQPLIAVRRYGRGEVVYLGFNETWRLRRRHGELYYRQFWGQMIHRLGLSHALGSQKRFVVRTDRRQYQADDKVIVTAEAYDANFEPLVADKLSDRKLTGELLLPDQTGAGAESRKIALGQLREGVFEARIPVFQAGPHRLRVKDPVTGEASEVNFQVAKLSAERRSAVRNVALQREIAQATGGKTYDLETASRLVDDVQLVPIVETNVKVFPLSATWLGFFAIVLLLLAEWLFRKSIHMA